MSNKLNGTRKVLTINRSDKYKDWHITRSQMKNNEIILTKKNNIPQITTIDTNMAQTLQIMVNKIKMVLANTINNNKPEFVCAYSRVSTPTQTQKGYGLLSQKRDIEESCKRNNQVMLGMFIDKSISGATEDEFEDDLDKRQGMLALLAYMKDIITETGIIPKVAVANTSRLWRNDVSKVLIRRELKKLKSEVVSASQPTYSIHDTDPNNFIVNSMLEMLDQYDRMVINLKLATGRKTKALTGNKPAGRLPYGYKYSNDRKSVIVDKDASKVIERIFTLKMRDYSLTEIANELNKKSSKSADKHIWTKQCIRQILNNDFYVGILTYANQKIIGKHENIISSSVWDAVHKNKDFKQYKMILTAII